MKKTLTLLLALILAATLFSGCGQSVGDSTASASYKYASFTTDAVGTYSATDPVAVITMEDGGVITVELRPDQAPNTVDNFIYLANNGLYDGLIFHRIIQGFMIQGGDPQGTGNGGPGYTIKGEFSANGFKQNILSHVTGTISMARTSGDMNSAGSQFFIMDADQPTGLDGSYAAFGSVLSGIDVVHNIATLPVTDSNGTVKRNADGTISQIGTIATIRVDTKGKNYPKPEITSGKLPY